MERDELGPEAALAGSGKVIGKVSERRQESVLKQWQREGMKKRRQTEERYLN